MTYPSFLANLWSGFFSVGSSQEKQTGDSVADVLPVDFKVDSLNTSMTTTPQGRLRGSSNMKEGKSPFLREAASPCLDEQERMDVESGKDNRHTTLVRQARLIAHMEA
ncbi:hypothetical protein Naga_100496g2 [Nannochloropsis gaditana]|uniref:Uncharacterized protein n=1 Tax=Nannochloropsis gaditana TaxID=72520 RepID=W7TBD8_9STRA|nr:hypothetical protein Naga_100496g2 [Nannochloropsis gaditana]